MAVYGIDFGTCYSCVAMAEDDGSITIVPSSTAQNSIPSIVMFNTRKDGKPIVGLTAKRALEHPNPQNVVAFIKTEMHEETTKKRYKITEEETRYLSPIEPTACIYYELFSNANQHRLGLGHQAINNAVITVPAVCSEKQREQTKIAAQLAGINVLQVINEPTAAAISYNIHVGETILVFDLGGGTLDVSIVQRTSENEYKVLSSEGNPNLGGKDWDRSLISLCYDNLGLTFCEDNVTEKQLILFEGYKIDICSAGDVEINFVDAEGIQQTISVTIEEFEQNSQHLINNALQVVDKAIASAKSHNEDLKIDRVCLAGGASNMPAIQRTLQQHLPTVPPILKQNPHFAICEGAAKYALSLSNENTNYHNINIDDRGHSYGLLTYDKNGDLVVENIILKNDPLAIVGRQFARYMGQAGNRLSIDIIENDYDDIQFKYKGQKTCFSGEVVFPTHLNIGEQVNLSLARDTDGVVCINVSYGNHLQPISFETKMTSISDDIIQKVRLFLSKMKN